MHGYRLQRPFRCCLPASALTVLSLLPSILQSLLIPSFTTSTTANLLLPPLQRSPSPASCDQWHPLRHQYTSHSTSNRLPPGCPSAQQPVLRALVVHPTALLLRMTPTLQPPLEPITSASPGPTTFVTLMTGTNPNTASSVFTSSAPSAFMARRRSAPLSDRERYEWPPAPRSGTRDRPRSSHDRPPSSLRRDDTADFERRPHSSIRRDDTADSERLERLETQLADSELRADRGRRGHSVNCAAERPSDSSNG